MLRVILESKKKNQLLTVFCIFIYYLRIYFFKRNIKSKHKNQYNTSLHEHNGLKPCENIIVNCTLRENNKNTVVFCTEMGLLVVIPLKYLYLQFLFKATAST